MLDKSVKIVVGADHFGLPLKDAVRDYLREKGYQVDDLGVTSQDPVDYPDVGAMVAEAVGAGQYTRGILVCGTGAGMAIVANKVPGVRAVCINDPYTAERAVASNNVAAHRQLSPNKWHGADHVLYSFTFHYCVKR